MPHVCASVAGRRNCGMAAIHLSAANRPQQREQLSFKNNNRFESLVQQHDQLNSIRPRRLGQRCRFRARIRRVRHQCLHGTTSRNAYSSKSLNPLSSTSFTRKLIHPPKPAAITTPINPHPHKFSPPALNARTTLHFLLPRSSRHRDSNPRFHSLG